MYTSSNHNCNLNINHKQKHIVAQINNGNKKPQQKNTKWKNI